MPEDDKSAAARARWAGRREIWSQQFALLQERMAYLEKLEAELVKISDRLSRNDIAEQTALLKERNRIANGLDDSRGDNYVEIYARLLASTESFREETERAIKLVENLLARHRPQARDK